MHRQQHKPRPENRQHHHGILLAHLGKRRPPERRSSRATLSVTSFRTYTNRGVYLTLGPYGSTGSFAYNEATHSETVAVSINSSIFNFTNGSITLTVNTSQSSSGNQINFRDGCMIYLTVQYSGGSSESPSSGSLNKSSVEVGGSISLTVNAASSRVYASGDMGMRPLLDHARAVRGAWPRTASSSRKPGQVPLRVPRPLRG